MFKFTIKYPKFNHGVECAIFEYPDYSPDQYEHEEIYVIAGNFKEAVELIKHEPSLSRNLTLNNIENVELIDSKVFLENSLL